jgi:hypothetical protein
VLLLSIGGFAFLVLLLLLLLLAAHHTYYQLVLSPAVGAQVQVFASEAASVEATCSSTAQ